MVHGPQLKHMGGHPHQFLDKNSETKLSLHRSNNRFLMEEFASAGYREQDLAHLNICRMFLHAVTISDIATVNGAEITQAAGEGCRVPTTGSTFSWPRVQSSLSETYWNTWRRAIRHCFLWPGSSCLIRQRLAKWNSPPARWEWFYSPSEDCLYKNELLLWRACPRLLNRTSPRRRVSKYRTSNPLSREPATDLIHASVDDRNGIVTKVATEFIQSPTTAPPQLCTLDDMRRKPSQK